MKLDRKFFERLATYFIGVAIGLVLLGIFHVMRSRSLPPQQQPTAESAPAPATDP